MFRRRRPLLRAAMVGGGAYYAGKHVQQGRDNEAEQDDRIDQLEQQQGPGAAPGGLTNETIDQLKQLGELKSSGVLTEEEFEGQKAKLLQST